MRDMAKKADLGILDEIIKMAEGAMAKGVSKKKPDLAVLQVSAEGKPKDQMASDMENEGDEEMDPQNKMEISEGGTSIEVEPEDGKELSDADLEELIAAYKAKKG